MQRSVAVTNDDDEITIADDDAGDLCGHGTACAGIVRSLAPDCDLTSVRVLGAGYTGSAKVLLAGLEWAIEQGFDVVNLSLSTTKKQYVGRLHELADEAYFKRAMLIASAHNMPVESFPWRFASVVSVGSHESADPYVLYANPDPPVEFFARGLNVEIAWLGGETITATGNSFATPHVAGLCALILSKHPELTPFQLKSVLHLTVDERRRRRRERPARSRRGRRLRRRRRVPRAAAGDGRDGARRSSTRRRPRCSCSTRRRDELVFEAVAGEGAGTLLGKRFPSSTGVAGWVLVTRQPLVVDDLTKDTRFSRDAAESTGYVPRGLMAVPLLADDTALGVLSVLDRPGDVPFTLAEMDLLGLFANQAAIALDLLRRARRAQAALEGDGELAALARFASRLEHADEDKREAGLAAATRARAAAGLA